MESAILGFFGGALGGFITGAIGALATDFLRTPVRAFFDLRGEVRQNMHEFANVHAKWKASKDEPDALIEVGISDEDEERLRTGQKVFRELAARMGAFADNEPLAAWVVRRFGYDCRKASGGLFGMANTLSTYGGSRAFQKKTVEDALKFKEA